MRTIRVAFCDFSTTDKAASAEWILKILKKYYDVQISDTPDYVFFHESTHEHLKYTSAIKIFYTLENIHPNFNICDYAISFDHMSFGDRHYRLPFYLVSPFYFADDADRQEAGDVLFRKEPPFTQADLLEKKGFCSFVYGNYLANKERELFFKKLNNYKKVASGGTYLNNVGGKVPSKLQFEKKHKFSIAFENSSREGYTTEKIVNALAARTIPIYWGNPNVGMEFNVKRFINCHDFKDMDAVIERVKEIDNDDAKYLEMVNQPIGVGKEFENIIYGFEVFLRNIIDQPQDQARRIRINQARYANLVSHIKVIRHYDAIRSRTMNILSLAYRPFKNITFLEKYKVIFFRKKLLRGSADQNIA